MQSPHWVLTVIIGRLQDDLAELDAAIGRGEPDVPQRLEQVCAGNVRDLQFLAGHHEAVRERTQELEEFTEAVRAGPGARMRQVRFDRPLLQELETKIVDRDLRIEELEKALASANVALEEAKFVAKPAVEPLASVLDRWEIANPVPTDERIRGLMLEARAADAGHRRAAVDAVLDRWAEALKATGISWTVDAIRELVHELRVASPAYSPLTLTDDERTREVKGEAAANTASELDRALDLLDAVSRGDAPAGEALAQLRRATDALEQSNPTILRSDADLQRAINGRPAPIRILDGGEVYDAEGRVIGRVEAADLQWARESLDAVRPARPPTLVPTDEDDERTVEILPVTKPAPITYPPLVGGDDEERVVMPPLSPPMGQCLHGFHTDARCERPVRAPGASFCSEHVPLPPEF